MMILMVTMVMTMKIMRVMVTRRTYATGESNTSEDIMDNNRTQKNYLQLNFVLCSILGFYTKCTTDIISLKEGYF